MSQLTHIQWFEDTIRNIEQISSYNSTYPKDKLIQSMKFVFNRYKNDTDIFNIMHELNAISEDNHAYVKSNIGINHKEIYALIIQIKCLEDAGQLNYRTAVNIIDLNTELGKEVRNIMFMAATKPFDNANTHTIDASIIAPIEHLFHKIHTAAMPEASRQAYEQLIQHDVFRSLLQPQQPCSLNLNAINGKNGQAMGWYAPSAHSLTLQKADAYVLIHETFHLIDHELENQHHADFSEDERIAFFHELYETLAQESNNNVLNPFDYMIYNSDNNKMIYKDSTMYDIFNGQINGVEHIEKSKINISKHWMQSWHNREKVLLGKNYFTTPSELLARLYTTAYSLAYPELDQLSSSNEEYLNRVTLSALRQDLLQKSDLQQKMKNWIIRFNDYANAALHNHPRQYAAQPKETLSSDFNQNALTIIRDIQAACLHKTGLISTTYTQAANVFSIVHYKNAQINQHFEDHITQHLETYYAAGQFSPERKSHHLLQALIDYRDGKLSANEIMKKVGFSSIVLDDTIASSICTKHTKVLDAYDTETALANNIFEYQEAALQI